MLWRPDRKRALVNDSGRTDDHLNQHHRRSDDHNPIRGKQILPGTRYLSDTRYRGALNKVGAEFGLKLASDGWRLVRPGPTDDRGDFLTFENYSDFPASRAGVVLSVWQATLSIDDVAAAYRSEDLIEAATEPIPTSLAGLDAIRLDVRAAADRSSFEPCAGFAFSDGIGLETIPACAWSRIWIVDVDGFAVSIIGNVGRYDGEGFDPDSILPADDAQHLLDGFINGLSLCTVATPCDD